MAAELKKKLRIPYPVLVEGKYDRLALENVCESATLLTTDGFGIFKNGEKAQLLRALAAKTPIIVLCDSDGAGKVIRSHLSSLLPKDRVIPVYTPRIEGKEKRKPTPSKEGVLGVEGMSADVLYALLSPYSEEAVGKKTASDGRRKITKTDLYEDGLCGRADSSSLRDAFCEKVGLPPRMTSNALLAALNYLLTYDEYLSLAGRNTTKTEAN